MPAYAYTCPECQSWFESDSERPGCPSCGARYEPEEVDDRSPALDVQAPTIRRLSPDSGLGVALFALGVLTNLYIAYEGLDIGLVALSLGLIAGVWVIYRFARRPRTSQEETEALIQGDDPIDAIRSSER